MKYKTHCCDSNIGIKESVKGIYCSYCCKEIFGWSMKPNILEWFLERIGYTEGFEKIDK